ncbi:hypothetical protein TCAL_07054 [Tigriopus californicus]|uniref:Uncharacterized protein n=1 Tax=Tigriopus californicus TaxID=6832 RepID=A0A553PP14_TIGCA|nr:UPF0488 protein C8orf33 homolog [Tigriopus californicus]TRY79410.1 hypothetical protein TCAL_07054 [Tigriopus californicus]|eukprot:TCALIF_07054-PA protein Name:"Similar to CG14286 UPF0488 protein CG14286 (Drosophila melanogaster)" AED:0.42 eAED:0.43 QI:0/0.5/0.33/1/1/1/3/29/151
MDEESLKKYEQELGWCIGRLRDNLHSGTLSDKQAKEAVKTLKSLESPKAPIPKKRMLMRSTFGDYRAQMELENDKFKIAPSLKDQTKPPMTSQFFKKSAQQTNPAGTEFRFNFGSATSARPPPTDTPGPSTSSHLNFQSSDNSFRFNFNGS